MIANVFNFFGKMWSYCYVSKYKYSFLFITFHYKSEIYYESKANYEKMIGINQLMFSDENKLSYRIVILQIITIYLQIELINRFYLL